MPCCVYHHRRRKFIQAMNSLDKRGQYPDFDNIIALDFKQGKLTLNATSLPIRRSLDEPYYLDITFNDKALDMNNLKVAFIAHDKIYVQGYRDHLEVPMHITSQPGELQIALYRSNQATYSHSGSVYSKIAEDGTEHFYVDTLGDPDTSTAYIHLLDEESEDIDSEHLIISDKTDDVDSKFDITIDGFLHIWATDRISSLFDDDNFFETSDIAMTRPIVIS